MMRTPRRQRAYDLTDGRCTYCHARLVDDAALVPCGNDSFVVPEGSEYLCVTLMKPRSAGGRTTAENEVPACPRCSATKGGLEHDAFVSRVAGSRDPSPSVEAAEFPREVDNWLHLGSALPAYVARNLDFSRSFESA